MPNPEAPDMLKLTDEFLNYQPRQDLQAFGVVPTAKWQALGEQKAIQVFQQAAQRVPAYRDFLSKHQVKADKVQTIADFAVVPPTSKKDYISQYPLKDLVMDGDLDKVTVFHYSSGSTAQPTLWPKSITQDFAALKGVELLFTYYWDIDQKSTLLINGLAMGAWPSGETIHAAVKLLAQKGRPISLISPGANMDQILNILQNLDDQYQQVIISGYPSFLKDVADAGSNLGIEWGKHHIKLLSGGEKPSANWQDYISQAFSLERSAHDVLCVYASSEAGVVGFTTPFTDFLRQYLYQHPQPQSLLSDRSDLPAIVQYMPPAKYVEIIEKEIVVTCGEYVPLIRYQTRDQGRIMAPDQILQHLGSDFASSYQAFEEPFGLPQLPLLTIDGRLDRTITMYGANIYPEQINAILDDPAIRAKLTGRFAANKTEDSQAQPHLTLEIELAQGVKADSELQQAIGRVLQDRLLTMNQEFAYIVEHVGPLALPEIVLSNYQSAATRPISGKGIALKK
jgi:phenylacetate-CoA ligase